MIYKFNAGDINLRKLISLTGNSRVLKICQSLGRQIISPLTLFDLTQW